MNSIILKGNIATDIESRTTQSGTNCTTFRIAVTRPFVNKSSGQRETDFFNCVAWRGTGEFIAKHFLKGNQILVQGTLQNRQYEAQDGSKRWVTEVMIETAEFCGSKNDGANHPNQGAKQPDANGYTEVDTDDLPF